MVVKLHKLGLAQCTIFAEVGQSETVILNFLKDPEGCGKKKRSGGLENVIWTRLEDLERLFLKTQVDPQPKLRPLKNISKVPAREGLKGSTEKFKS